MEENSHTVGDVAENLTNFNLESSPPLSMRDHYTSELTPFALQQMERNSHYVEDVNVKMRIPSKLTVAYHDDDNLTQGHTNGDNSYSMEVPEKIIVSVGDGGVQYTGPKDSSREPFRQDLSISDQTEPISLQTPPRKLTLAERDLDALDVRNCQEKPRSYTDQTNTQDSTSLLDQQADSMYSDEQDDGAVLRRQIFKLHRRITTIEKQHAERSKRETYVYAVSIALLFVNAWLLYTSRKP